MFKDLTIHRNCTKMPLKLQKISNKDKLYWLEVLVSAAFLPILLKLLKIMVLKILLFAQIIVELTIGVSEYYLGTNRLKEWFHHMWEKIKNSKDNTYQGSLKWN
jgi:hypothetical protein